MNKKEKTGKEIKELTEKYKLGTLSFQTGISKKYSCFFWWRIVFTPEVRDSLHKDNKDYEGIHLMPYFVGEALYEEIKASKHFGNKYDFPNIDIKSGNLHPKWDEADVYEWSKSPAIRQAILVKSNKHNDRSHWGPLKELFSISNNSNFSNIARPECYYPKPDNNSENNESIESVLIGLLKQVLDKESELYRKIAVVENNT